MICWKGVDWKVLGNSQTPWVPQGGPWTSALKHRAELALGEHLVTLPLALPLLLLPATPLVLDTAPESGIAPGLQNGSCTGPASSQHWWLSLGLKGRALATWPPNLSGVGVEFLDSMRENGLFPPAKFIWGEIPLVCVLTVKRNHKCPWPLACGSTTPWADWLCTVSFSFSIGLLWATYSSWLNMSWDMTSFFNDCVGLKEPLDPQKDLIIQCSSCLSRWQYCLDGKMVCQLNFNGYELFLSIMNKHTLKWNESNPSIWLTWFCYILRCRKEKISLY